MMEGELVALKGGYDGTGSRWVCKYIDGETRIILGCVSSEWTCDYGMAWDACKLYFPDMNQMAGGCIGYDPSCQSF